MVDNNSEPSTSVPESAQAEFAELLKAWQDERLEVRKQAAAALDALANSWGAVSRLVSVLRVQEMKESGSESDRPAMPTSSFIVECLIRDFQLDTSNASMDSLSANLMIEKLKQVKVTLLEDEYKFLAKHILLYLSIPERTLGKYAGLYAYDGARLLQLNGVLAQKHLTQLFQREAVQLDQIDRIELVDLLTRALLPMRTLGYSPRGHLVVGPSAQNEYESAISLPSVVEDNGWTVHFWTMFMWGGCTARTPLLFEHTLVFSADYEIAYEEPNIDEMS
jgi:hypothetical protein